jgi:hypothetical protein
MYLSAVIGWPLFIATLMAVFICSWLASFALWPEMVKKGAERYGRPWATTGAGLLVTLPGGLAGAALSHANEPLLKIIGIIMLGSIILIGVVGSTGLCLRVGQGLASPADKDRPWRAVLRGGVVMAFVCLFPVIGWIGVLLWMLISGCGVVILPQRLRVPASASVSAASRQSPETAPATPPIPAHQTRPPVMAPDEAPQTGS